MMRKARVAHLIASNFFGGPERQILVHAKRLKQTNYEPFIISFQEKCIENALYKLVKKENIKFEMIRSREPFHPGSVTELIKMLHSQKVNLLATHGYKANVIGRIASWCKCIPEIAVSRGWTGENKRVRLYEKLDRIFLRFADHVVTVSEGQREKVKSCGVRCEKISVIHNAMDLDSFPGPQWNRIRQEFGVSESSVLIISAGRLSPEKNFLGLIEAAKHVLEKRKDARFIVFGEGFLRSELEKAVAEANIQDSFFLPGFRPDVRSLLHEADIFVLPSHTEGLPNVVLEAFACKKPVVATAVGGTPEVVRHGQDGYLTDPGDMEAVAEGLLELASSPEKRYAMGESGYEHVRSSFDFASQTAKYMDLYKSVLEKNGKALVRA